MTAVWRKYGWACAALFAALFACVMTPAMAKDKTIVVGVEPAYAPWAFVDKGDIKGIAPDALRAMAAQQGFKVKFKSLPFSSLIPALLADKIDVVATALTVSEKRAEKIAFTVPWWQVNMTLLVKQGAGKNMVTGLSGGSRVGTMTGTTELTWLKKLKKDGVDLNIHTYSEATTGVRDLMIGRLDGFLADTGPAVNFQKHYPEKIRIAGNVVTNPPQVYALGVRLGDKDLLALLNKAEVHLYQSGKWAEVIHKYQPDATVTKVPGPMDRNISSYKKPVAGLGADQ